MRRSFSAKCDFVAVLVNVTDCGAEPLRSAVIRLLQTSVKLVAEIRDWLPGLAFQN